MIIVVGMLVRPGRGQARRLALAEARFWQLASMTAALLALLTGWAFARMLLLMFTLYTATWIKIYLMLRLLAVTRW